MVKGPARNAQFYYITEHIMPRYGFRSFQEALATGRLEWKKLTDLERAPWKAKEQQWKAYMRGPAGDKFRKDCSGNNMQEELDKAKEREAFEQRVYQAVIDYIKPRDQVVDQPFYFISFEYALEDDYGKYYPCEVGLVKYSLRRGIEKCLHYFLKPGDYPLGTKAAAKKHSEERHKIPYLGFELATDGYSAVFAHMRDILLNRTSGSSDVDGSATSQYPPIFCLPQDVDMNRKCLQVLFDRAQRHESEKITVVASASILMSKFFGDDICGESKAHELLATTSFDHEKGVACDWHYDKECINCALGTARKIAYIFSDAFKLPYDLKLTPNHLPTVVPISTLPDTAELLSWNSRGGASFSSRSVVSSVVGSTYRKRDGGDSVVSGASYRRADESSLVSGFSQMKVTDTASAVGAWGRGRGAMPPSSSFTQPTVGRSANQEYGQSEVPFDDDEDSQWTTVKRDGRHAASQPQGKRYDDDDWTTVSGDRRTVSQSAWNNGNQGRSNTANVQSVGDWDDWEGGSVVSSTVQSRTSRPLSSNPYAQPSSGFGRGRGLEHR